MLTPELTGLELIEFARKRHPKIGAVICTGFGEKVIRKLGKGTKSLTVLEKPISIWDLRETLDKLVA